MSNPTIGRIVCPICKASGEVRRYKGSDRGKLYWSCDCGQIRPALGKGQAYIEAHATFGDAPAPAAAPEPAPAASAVKPQPPAPVKRSGLSAFLADL